MGKRLPLILLVLVLTACKPGQTFVDGYPIGEQVDTETQPFTDFATAALDRDNPGHAAIASTSLYAPDYRNAQGDTILHIRSSGSDRIVVFRLADETVKAYYVGCGVGIDPDVCFLGTPDMFTGDSAP